MVDRRFEAGLAIHWMDEPMEEIVDLIRTGESCGYDQLWFTNDRFFHDMYVTATMAALLTDRAALGTFVSDPYSLHPAMTAVAASTLDKVSGGRGIICMGAGGRGFREMELQRVKPAKAIREAVELIRRLVKNETVDFDGDVVRFRNGRLGMTARPDIPIYVASRGDLVLRTAGEVADGVIVATYADPDGVAHGLRQVYDGAARRASSLRHLKIISRVDACIHKDRAVAIDAVRGNVGVALWASYPDRRFVDVVGLKVPDDLEEIIMQRDYELLKRNGHLVPDDFVLKFAWAGTAEDVARQVAAVAASGIESFTIMPIAAAGQTRSDVARAFAEEVMPAVQSICAEAETS